MREHLAAHEAAGLGQGKALGWVLQGGGRREAGSCRGGEGGRRGPAGGGKEGGGVPREAREEREGEADYPGRSG